jgi:hypothetical protein
LTNFVNKSDAVKLTQSQIDTEKDLCTSNAESYPKNYYAWMHRIWLLQFMSMRGLDGELQFTKEWLLQHTSDHSAVNHRGQVLKRLFSIFGKEYKQSLDYINASGSLFVSLYDDSNFMILTRPGSESMWYTRRAVTMLLINEFIPRLFSLTRRPKKILTKHGRAIDAAAGSVEKLCKYAVKSMFPSEEDMYYDDSDPEDVNGAIEYKRIETSRSSRSMTARSSFSDTGNKKGKNRSTMEYLLSKMESDDLDTPTTKPFWQQWLSVWLAEEMEFCLVSVEGTEEHEVSWNVDQQKLYALRYIAYILHAVMCMGHLHPTSPRETNWLKKDCNNAIRVVTGKLIEVEKLQRCWRTIRDKTFDGDA